MKTKFFALLAAICLLFAAAAPSFAAADHAQSLADDIIEANGGDAQAWIDGALCESAGKGSEWNVLALSHRGKYDFSRFEQAMLAYLDETSVRSASSRQKFALTLLAAGSSAPYIDEVAREAAGQQGIMSWVFALHLHNNGVTGSHSASDLIGPILSLQLDDGGWAVSGAHADVDVTAMTLQALAPNREADGVQEAVDRALALLADRQKDDGNFASYGVNNPESACQVIIALSALGIDCTTDERFLKNGRDLFDVVETYRLAPGSYAHQDGGGANLTAALQVFCACTAYSLLPSGGSFYLFAPVSQPPAETTAAVTTSAATTAAATTAATTAAAVPVEQEGFPQWKLWALGITGGLTLIGALALVITKKGHPKNFLALLIAAAAAVVLILSLNIRSAGSYYHGTAAAKPDAIGTVNFTIRCDTVAGQADHIPADGMILAPTTFAIAPGDTVWDIMVEAARLHTIQVETTGVGELIYVSGIGYLYEFDYGDLSGWIYQVNGETHSTGCAAYELSDGDEVVWHYSLELGNDIP